MKNKNKMGLFIIKIALVLICLNKTYEEMKLKKEKRIKTIRILDGQDSTYDIDKEDETTIEESDISTKGIESSSIEKTDTYKWLIKNSYKYGFIRRYEERKAAITGYKPESWHFRYLGVDMAKKVYEEGITYDEYYAFYLDK